MLLEVAKRLAASIRASDTAARFGGDEFAVLLEDVEQRAGGGRHGRADPRRRSRSRCALEGKELFVRSQPRHLDRRGRAAADADELIRNADAAMYIAKRDGKGGYRLFEPAMHEGVLARLELRADLQRAMVAGQLELYYQPLVRLRTARVSGRRGAAALAPPRARAGRPRRLHPARRGDGPDRADRALGAARGLPPGRPIAAAGCRASRR